MTQFLKPLTFVVCALAALSTSALADRKPSGSKPADPQVIINAHLGKTWDWTEGASYWGNGGAFMAVWKDSATDDGKWYVTTRGTMCYEAFWSSRAQDGALKVNEDVTKLCWQHVRDKDGQIWQRAHDKNEWYRLNTDKLATGNDVAKRIKAWRKSF